MRLFAHQVSHSQAKFASGGQQITVEMFAPAAQGKYPAVVALHGSGGLHSGGFADPARLLAASGFAVFVPHYFERTGTAWADDATIRREFESWTETISDAITFAVAQPKTDAAHLGLLGFSLGGYLALAIATEDSRVRAVVEYFGGLPEELEQAATKMPPVLILHGDADTRVPVSEAHRLRALLERTNTPHEIQIYRGAGHTFSGFTMLDAAQRTLAFLQKHLGKPAEQKAG